MESLIRAAREMRNKISRNAIAHFYSFPLANAFSVHVYVCVCVFLYVATLRSDYLRFDRVWINFRFQRPIS